MKIIGITPAELNACIDVVNIEYAGNLRIENERHTSKSVSFVLRVNNSRAYGARTSWSGRHTPSASWEAHRDLFRAVYRHNPEARIVTALATYDGSEDFERSFPATGRKNVGSLAHPVTMPQLSVLR